MRPLADARLWAWVQRANNGYAAASVRTDEEGNFHYPTFPDAYIVLQAFNAEYDQPCASTVQLTSNGANATIEVVSRSAPIFDPDPPAPSLRGVVFELTAEGRRPLAGARVEANIFMESIAAITTTDEQGRYSLCRVPTDRTYLVTWKPGYVLKETIVPLSGVVTLDVEMTRK